MPRKLSRKRVQMSNTKRGVKSYRKIKSRKLKRGGEGAAAAAGGALEGEGGGALEGEGAGGGEAPPRPAPPAAATAAAPPRAGVEGSGGGEGATAGAEGLGLGAGAGGNTTTTTTTTTTAAEAGLAAAEAGLEGLEERPGGGPPAATAAELAEAGLAEAGLAAGLAAKPKTSMFGKIFSSSTPEENLSKAIDLMLRVKETEIPKTIDLIKRAQSGITLDEETQRKYNLLL